MTAQPRTLGSELSFVLEPHLLRLQDVGAGDLRLSSIYLAVRDPSWDTFPFESWQAETSGGVTIIKAHVFAPGTGDRPIFAWELKVASSADQVRLEATGECLLPFQSNRLGFCVLLPGLMAGVSWQAEDQSGVLPADISAHQLVSGFTRLELKSGRSTLELDLEGEIFEMEDQRNWTDASYKIYGPPLDRPFPVSLQPGDTIRQAITVTASGPADRWRGDPLDHIGASWFPGTSRPALGLAMDTEQAISTADFRFLSMAPSAEAAQDCPAEACHLRLLCDEATPSDVQLFLKNLPAKPQALVLTRSTLDEAMAPIVAAARSAYSGPVLVGTSRFFAEVNRSTLDVRDLPADGLAYSINPQMHAFDDASLFETIPIQAETVRMALRQHPTIAIAELGLSPPHWPGEDERLHTEIGAAWFVASLATLSKAGVSSIWAFGAGPRGLKPGTPIADWLERWADAIADRSWWLLQSEDPRIVGIRHADKAAIVNCGAKRATIRLDEGLLQLPPLTLTEWRCAA